MADLPDGKQPHSFTSRVLPPSIVIVPQYEDCYVVFVLIIDILAYIPVMIPETHLNFKRSRLVAGFKKK
jgi:hypothetical protein